MRAAIFVCILVATIALANGSIMPDSVNAGLGKLMNNPLTGTYVKSACKAYGYCTVEETCAESGWFGALSDLAGAAYAKTVALTMSEDQKKAVCEQSGYYKAE